MQTPRICKLRVAVPASLVSDTPHLREKTAKLGSIARTCAIFGVSEIVLYPDDPRHDQKQEFDLCKLILGFIETPQYLRKRMFGLHPDLKFTGILPPLQAPPHNVSSDLGKCRVGDIRDGVIVGSRKSELELDVGLGRILKSSGTFPVGSRVTLRITSLGRFLAGDIVPDSEKPVNWGYRVRTSALGLAELISNSHADLKIGTSRYGTSIAQIWPSIAHSLITASSVVVAFGSPKNGLQDILKAEGTTAKDVFNYFINTVPVQNVTTVRTEEAILISLSLLNLARHNAS